MPGELHFDASNGDDVGGVHAPACRQGTRFYIEIRLHNFDATNTVARMQVRRSPEDQAVALELTEANGRIVWLARGSTTTDARFALDVPATVTKTIAALNAYGYDIELVPGGVEADAWAVFAGRFKVDAEVTR